MASQADVEALQKQVMDQAEAVRQAKADGKSKKQYQPEIDKLKKLKKELDAIMPKADKDNSDQFNRPALENLLRSRFFLCQSFEIYGGVAGFYDFGPPGCAVKENILNEWKRHFVLQEKMLQVACTSLTPDVVLRTSGHAQRFADFLVKDVVNGDPFRADHVLEDKLKALISKSKSADDIDKMETIMGQVDAYSQSELGALLKEYQCKSPDTGNDLTDPIPFNLMFQTQIGPSGMLPGFLRPETAQGIFINFNRLLDYNNGKLPFAAAQIGDAYRNEIAPRAGLLRVREFTMAEIEHFVHPDHKEHPNFEDVADLELKLFGQTSQLSNSGTKKMTIGAAVEQGLVDNQTLGYFIARTFLFLTHIGIKPDHLRFRQHLPTEMAHYASDCWDAEIECSYGWIECVGIADRSCYDLKVHSQASKVSLTAFETFDTPIEVEELQTLPNKKVLGKTLRKDAGKVIAHVESLSDDGKLDLAKQLEAGGVDLNVGGETFSVTAEMFEFKTVTVKKAGKSFYPSVVEPSFGIGRILYCLMEHSYWHREGDEQRSVISLPSCIAPVKVCVLPISAQPQFEPIIKEAVRHLTALSLANKVDTSGASIGKRYARTDEIAVPFAMTIDFETPKDGTVTLRERDSCEQVRGPMVDMIRCVKCLVEGIMTWDQVKSSWAK